MGESRSLQNTQEKKKSFTANTYIYYEQNEKMRAKIITAKRRAAVGVPGGETINWAI